MRHLNTKEIALYVDAMRLERTADLPEGIRLHAAACEQCKKEVLFALELTDGLPYTGDEPHPWFDRPPARPHTAWQTAWRIAAILAVAVGLGGLWYVLGPPGEDAPTAVVETREPAAAPEARTTAPPAEDLAGRFEPSPNLEDLVGTPLRSSQVVAYSPPAGATVGDTVDLVWRTGAGGPFEVSILDNADRTILDTALSASAVSLRTRLEPGLYYWRVVARGKLQFVAKFLVRREQAQSAPM